MKLNLLAVVSALIVLVAPGIVAIPLHAQESGPAYTSSPPEVEAADETAATTDSQSEQVLELPQAAATDTQSQAGNGDDPTDFADAGDVPGDANDYANQGAVNNPGPEYANSAPVMISPPMVAYPINPNRNYSLYIPPNVIVARPGGVNSIPATSPMLTTPPGSHPLLGGWWQRAHR
jgi:hypothetical protein